jgi:hypothetical protein
MTTHMHCLCTRRDLPNADIYVKKLLRAVKEAAQRPPEEAKMPAALQVADQQGTG